MKNREAFVKLKESKIIEAVKFEKKESYEMAYISLWLVLEQGLKLYASEGMKIQLHSKIKAWDDFLAGDSNKKPKQIGNFSIEYTSNSIPQMSLVEKALGRMPQVSKVMDTKGKWRNRRNRIAHDAADFYNKDKYLEYKHEIFLAIDELSRKVGLHATQTKT